MRVLVTGGAGFIGSHIVDRFLATGATVLVVDDLSTGKLANLDRSAELAELDIGSPEVPPLMKGFRPEVVVHCAAQPSVAVSTENPALDARVNIVAGINVCQSAVEASCGQIVYITTGGALYGHSDDLPFGEEHAKQPVSPYGLSKWTLECYLDMLLPDTIARKILRLANVYGPRQDPHGEAGVVSIFGGRMLAGDEVVIFGDGEQTRDFVYVADVTRAVALACEAGQSLTVNISSQHGTSVNELFRLMASETGYSRPPIHAPERPGEMRHSVLANSRAKELLSWQPETSLADGLRATLDSLRSERRGVVS